MIKAVIMDVDGTLYRLKPVRLRMAWRLLCFVACQPRLGWKTIRVLRAYRRAQEVLRGDAAPSKSALRQVETAARFTGYSPKFIRDSVSRWMEDEPLDVVANSRYPGVIEFFNWARQQNIQLAVVSDYDPRKKMRALKLDSYISIAIWAQQAEIGVFKPNPRGLRAALDRLGIKPAQAIYVGDRGKVDATAALAAGMPAILLGGNASDSRPGVSIIGDWKSLRKFVESLSPAQEVGVGV